MSEIRNNNPIEWMRNLVSTWVEPKEPDAAHLLNWLQGSELPPVGHQEEPFLWLLRGIPVGSHRYEAERKMASAAARILAMEPDLNPVGKRPDQLLYNLLMLCAGLGATDELAEQLYSVLGRQTVNGRWMGNDLRGTLRAALIENQIDNRLKPVWEAMLSGTRGESLPGNRYDGFEGILLMPLSPDRREQPDLDAIGSALTVLAGVLKEEEDKRSDFRYLVSRVYEAYPGRPSLQEELVRQADKNNWPTWALEALPTLYFPAIHQKSNKNEFFYVWRPVVDVVEGVYSFSEEGGLCQNQVVLVRMPQETLDFVEQIAPVFDWNRINNPYHTVRSGIAVTTDTMAELELSCKYDTKAAYALRTARERTLGLRGIGYARPVAH